VTNVAARAFGILAVLLLLWVQVVPSGAAQEAPQASAEQQLADKYAPITYLRTQSHDCAPVPSDGEPYMPVPVEVVLDNPAVVLRDSTTDEILATGVDAIELATYGPDTYLDWPGDPLQPGCVYERDERARMAELGAVPTIYAKVLFDPEGQRLSLQYWFFYYYNDWNNTHEGDWEGIVIFWDDVDSVEAALASPPSRTGYAQHGGGELAEWGDSKIELEDETHPVVYPAAGAHATFYSNSLYLAWGEQGSGFGCDYSSPPSTRVETEVVLVPNDPDPNGEFAWLLWEGRWGQRKPSMFNGPTGPNLNARWLDPWEATDDWRTFSIVVPSNFSFGPSMADSFCTLTHAGSRLLISTVLYPWLAIPMIAAVVAIFGFAFRKARYLWVQARQLYVRQWKVFVAIGLVAVPLGFLFNGIQLWLANHQPARQLIDWFDDADGARLIVVILIGGFQQLVMLLFIAPAVIQVVKDVKEGETPSLARAVRKSISRVPAIVLAALIIGAILAIPMLVLVGIPVAIWLLIRWQFFAQALIFDRDINSYECLEESARLVRGRWWKTLLAIALFDFLALVPGFVIGFALMALGGTYIGYANAVSSLLYALTIPIAVIATTIMYLDRRGTPLNPRITEPST
jgi:ABC-type sulfate transport system permease subunit